MIPPHLADRLRIRVLNTPIAKTELSGRAIKAIERCLVAEGTKSPITVSDVATLSQWRLLGTRGVGRSTVWEIERWLLHQVIDSLIYRQQHREESRIT